MKVLHVITGLENGGAEAVLMRLIASSQSPDIHHHVISLMGRGIYADQLEQIGVQVSVLEFSRGRITLAGVFRLFRIMKLINPDVVQTWMYHADLIGGVVARLTGVRAILWGIRHANLDPAHNSRTTLRIVRFCARLSRWVPRKIISCSAQATQLHKRAGYRADKFVQIPNGYNMERFRPDKPGRNAVRAELGVTADTFVLGMVARFDIQKNHQNLLEALGQLKRRGVQFICVLVGVGMDEANSVLRGWIEKAGVEGNIKLLGPRSDVPAVMSALDVHVLSSLGEAFPNVLAEAMACGTPCVTTDVGDAAVIVAEHGWVVSPKDATALADGLTQAHGLFAGNQVRWQERQAACRSHIMANFALEKMCERYREAWQACLQS